MQRRQDRELLSVRLPFVRKGVMEIKCAFDHQHYCNALAVKNCNGCRFYKERDALDDERAKSMIRLQRLKKWERYKKQYNLKDVIFGREK